MLILLPAIRNEYTLLARPLAPGILQVTHCTGRYFLFTFLLQVLQRDAGGNVLFFSPGFRKAKMKIVNSKCF